MALVSYTFKIEPELKRKMPDIARRHGFTPPQLLRAVLTQLDSGELILKFHQNARPTKGQRVASPVEDFLIDEEVLIDEPLPRLPLSSQSKKVKIKIGGKVLSP